MDVILICTLCVVQKKKTKGAKEREKMRKTEKKMKAMSDTDRKLKNVMMTAGWTSAAKFARYKVHWGVACLLLTCSREKAVNVAIYWIHTYICL